jgi:hypothetical protein
VEGSDVKSRCIKGSAIAWASSAVLWLMACSDEPDFAGQSSNLPSAGSGGTDGQPGFSASCTCAMSPSLKPLSCGAGEVPLLDNDIVQLTPDGSIAAFNIDVDRTPFAVDYQIHYWDGGPSARAIFSGLLIGLSAAGDRVLANSDTGLALIDMNAEPARFALDPVTGRGSLSAGGDTVVGAIYDSDSAELVRVTVDTRQFRSLGRISNSIARAYVNPDATAIVGTGITFRGSTENPVEELLTEPAFLWNANGLVLGLPGVPAPIDVWPEAISSDGTVIAGRSPTTSTHFRWTEAFGYVEIASASGRSETLSSGDGSVVVGSLDPEGDDDSAAFRWTETTGAIDLTPGRASFATDMSEDGGVVVATSWEAAQLDGRLPEATFIWDSEHGTRTLDQLLLERGVDVSGWLFGQARALSNDGKVLLGRAFCGGVPALYRIVLSD